MIGYAPFVGHPRIAPPMLGQVIAPPVYENPSDVAKRLYDEIVAAVSPYGDIPFDAATMSALRSKVDQCQTMALRVNSDPDLAAAKANAEKCIGELRDSLKTASDAYYARTGTREESGAAMGLIIPGIIVAASIGVSAYHGYKRNKSTGWGVWWGFMGLLFPVVTPVVAIAQGYGKRAK